MPGCSFYDFLAIVGRRLESCVLNLPIYFDQCHVGRGKVE
jgi:hypothetical protein